MRRLLITLLFPLLFVISCGESTTGTGNIEDSAHADNLNSSDDTDDAVNFEMDSNNDSNDKDNIDNGNTGDSGNSGDTGNTGDTATEDKYCIKSCSTAADCATNENSLSDENNWQCINGGCKYLGCVNDNECKELYGGSGQNYLCDKDGPYGNGQCVLACSSTSDCDLSGAGSTEHAYDSDNYECKNGYCKYTGCNNDSECATSMMSEDFACLFWEEFNVKLCMLKCSTADDCGNDAIPAEGYNCIDSKCINKTCSDAAWCKEVYGEEFGCHSK